MHNWIVFESDPLNVHNSTSVVCMIEKKGRETCVSHPNWIMKQEEKVSMFEPWVDDSDTNQMFIWFSLFPSFQGKNVVKLVA